MFRVKPSHDSDVVDVNDDSYEQLGQSYQVSSSGLSASERAAAARWQRPQRDEEEVETKPLPAKYKDVTYGAMLLPFKTHKYKYDLQAYSTALSSSSNVLAVGCKQGKVVMLNPASLEHMDMIDLSRQGSQDVCAAIRFRPDVAGSNMQNVLLVGQGSRLFHVHAATKQILRQTVEENNLISAVSVRNDAKMSATAGSDGTVRVYDEGTGQVTLKLDHGDNVNTAGHSNSIQSISWKADDPQVLLSGGWDRTIQLWDLRLQRSVRSISGPYLCGDALDVQGNTVLTGSWRNSNPVQLWDFRTCVLLTNLPWYQAEQDACLPYAAAFGKGDFKNYIFAGGSGKKPLARVYQQDASGNIKLVGSASTPGAVIALDSTASAKDKKLFVCCATHMYSFDLS